MILAATLAKRCGEIPVLHDRRMPGRSSANIDHIAVAASGVYVIDTKRYKGKIEVAKPLFGRPKLEVAGRDQTKLIEGLTRQVAAVRSALADLGHDGVPLHGCLCFVAPAGLLAGGGLPSLRTLRIDGYALYSPAKLARRLNGRGPLTPERAVALQLELAVRFPAA